MRDRKLTSLERILGVRFRDRDLLLGAITHRSYLNEHRDEATQRIGHNDLMEFLGDSVLELVVTEYLYRHNPGMEEGFLTDVRSRLVNTRELIRIAKSLGLCRFLRQSRGQTEDSRRAAGQRVFADMFEALIGAIYLDQDLEATRDFIHRHVITRLDSILVSELVPARSRLQELAQARDGLTPVYRTLGSEGPDHDTVWEVAVLIGDRELARGKGVGKPAASENAAQTALSHYVD